MNKAENWIFSSFADIQKIIDPLQFISYDSEFIREKFYVPQLALIQIHQENWQEAQLIDPLGDELPKFWKIIEQLKAPLVLHSGLQDLELMLKNAAPLPQIVLDTQIGFSLLTPVKDISYAQLIENLLGLKINKTQCRSNWLKRPLSLEQYHYAQADVFYLSQIFPLIYEQLDKLNRISWWIEEGEYLMKKSSQLGEFHWFNLKFANIKIPHNAIENAEILVQIRENIAQKLNLPRNKIMSDEKLIKLAKSNLNNPEKVAADQIFHRFSEIDASFIDSIIEKASQNDIPQKPRAIRLTKANRQYLEKLDIFRKNAAHDLNIHPDTLATYKQLKSFVLHPEKSKLNNGWRKNIFINF